jgi:hypothetical protein
VTAVPDRPLTRDARAAVAVAFCPSPPLLLPDVEGAAAPETDELRRACAEAVERMLAHQPQVAVVVGAGLAPGVRLGSGDRGDLHGYGADRAVAFDGRARPDGRALPLAHTLGAWLLDEAGFSGARVGVGPADFAQLVRDLPGPLGVLAMGDGSARRTLKAPGYLDDAAGPFDAAVAGALAEGDAGALAAIDLAEGERLLAAGAATWQAVGAALAGRVVVATLHLDAAPFGVGYLVADWLVA